MRLLALAASLRRGSLNRRLLEEAARRARDLGAEVEVVDFAAFEMPLYNQDLQDEGFPAGAQEFKRQIEATDGMILASPEYNYSLPGHLKNAIDWVSRFHPMPLRGKSALLLSASPSMVGGIRGLWQLRIPLEGLGVFVYPDMFALASADEAFDSHGHLKDPNLEGRLQHTLEGYWRFARAVARR